MKGGSCLPVHGFSCVLRVEQRFGGCCYLLFPKPGRPPLTTNPFLLPDGVRLAYSSMIELTFSMLSLQGLSMNWSIEFLSRFCIYLRSVSGVGCGLGEISTLLHDQYGFNLAALRSKPSTLVAVS